ncbi:NACHT domain-containing protein [Actinokineospora sp. HUAS TT18]|uniref:NACHT domain-containing protein n=1 Tax=Actinokineospora sp. HUAS TT18 TaxID=3447451 RepID=UPI003F51D50B
MRKNPALTFQGALRILGKHDSPTIGKLDKALGLGLLVGGGAAALLAPPLAPIAVFGALWGWVDQKNETIGLLRAAVAGLSKRLSGVRGLERRELLAAAHTTLVVAAYFEVIEEIIGEKAFKALEISDAEKVMIRNETKGMFGSLYTREVPAPSAAVGAREHRAELVKWYAGFDFAFRDFVDGLASATRMSQNAKVPQRILAKYESMFIDLAAQVPEFAIWASVGEHAATRTAVRDTVAPVREILSTHHGALSRVERLLGLVAAETKARDLCEVLSKANRGVLNDPIVPDDTRRSDSLISYPAIRDIFVNPRYKVAENDADVRPADETWWRDRPVFDDLDVFMTAHLTAPGATRLPMLVLGHPGAGKSLLTKVLAARLPASDYTVVRVPLRSVGANAPVADQVQQALDAATHRRILWHELAEQSAATVRVVLLDGLDELLQAAQLDRGAYLQEVMRFQQIEADQDRPVIVLVTSRTLVADRVDIPRGTPVIKLEDFTDEQIDTWLSAWRNANLTAIESGAMRGLTSTEALHQRALACQPLLLMMLAVYAADPAAPRLDADLSTAALYERIFENFAAREVAKRAPHRLTPAEAAAGIEDHIGRLSVAALAMFNRGLKCIGERELQADLQVIGKPRPDAPAHEQGRRLLGEFFFVHSPEANRLSPDSTRTDLERAYEFLHATFGEYLVAAWIIDELRDIADAAYGGKRGDREPDDSLLFAVLSHEAIATSAPTRDFAAELFARLAEDERAQIHRALVALIAGYRRRRRSDDYAAYRPTERDAVRELAAYSANLYLLAVYFQAGPIHIDDYWSPAVELWSVGLDGVAWSAQVRSLHRAGDEIHPFASDAPPQLTWALAARLAGWRADRERHGTAIADGVTYFDPHDWADSMGSWLVAATAGIDCAMFVRPAPTSTSAIEIVDVVNLMSNFLRIRVAYLRPEFVDSCIEFIEGCSLDMRLDERMLLALAYFHPGVFVRYPFLHRPELFESVRDELRYVLVHGSRARIEGWEAMMARLDEPDPEVGISAAAMLLNTLMGNNVLVERSRVSPEMLGEEGRNMVADPVN